MTKTQAAKAETFRGLHEGPGAIILPNAWDAGSARLLAAAGFPALASTSAGIAYALGRPDASSALSRDRPGAASQERSVSHSSSRPRSSCCSCSGGIR